MPITGPVSGNGQFAALGDEAAATDDNTAAAEAYQAAHELTAGTGDACAAAALVPRMVAVAHLLGENLPVRVGVLQAALDSLDGVAGADRERARLGSAMAAAYLVDDRLDEAIPRGEASRAESERIGDDEAALNTGAASPPRSPRSSSWVTWRWDARIGPRHRPARRGL
jgi:purine nucleoside permease